MEQRRKSSLKTPTVMFFIFAIACVVAFLIVILVKSCEADHEEDVLLEENAAPITQIFQPTESHILTIS